MGSKHDKLKKIRYLDDYQSDTEMEKERSHRLNSSKKRDRPLSNGRSTSRSRQGNGRSTSRLKQGNGRSTSRSRQDNRSTSRSRQDNYRNKSKDADSPNSLELYCEVCNIYCTGLNNWQQHVCGKRHASFMLQIERGKKDELYQDSYKKRKSLERKNYQNKKRKLDEETNEKKDLLGLDYVLVIHKQGKSVFQCFLCDACITYHNSKQLTDHVYGDKHQKAYVEQHDKGLIKIKRLKSKHPGKDALEQSIEQMLLNPNRKDTFETRFPDPPQVRRACDYLSSCDKDSNKTNHRSATIKKGTKTNNFLRKTIEQVEIHNRRYASKTMSSAFVPERKSSSATPESVSSKDLTPACQTISSPICSPSLKSPCSQNSTVSLSVKKVNDPVASKKTAISKISELKDTLTMVDVFKLVISKLENFHLPTKKEFDLLNEVAENSTKLRKEFKQMFTSTVQESVPSIKEERVDNSTRTDKTLIEIKSTVENIPFINDVREDIFIRTDETLIEVKSAVESLHVMESSASPAGISKNPLVIVPDSVWCNLPSQQDIDNVKSSLSSKGKTDAIESSPNERKAE